MIHFTQMLFEVLQAKYHIPKTDFFKYLQIRHLAQIRHGSLSLKTSDFLDNFFLKKAEHE